MATAMINTDFMKQIQSGVYKTVGTMIVPTKDEKQNVYTAVDIVAFTLTEEIARTALVVFKAMENFTAEIINPKDYKHFERAFLVASRMYELFDTEESKIADRMTRAVAEAKFT